MVCSMGNGKNIRTFYLFYPANGVLHGRLTCY